MDGQVAREKFEVFKPIAAGYRYEFIMYHHEIKYVVTRNGYQVGTTLEELFRRMYLQIDF